MMLTKKTKLQRWVEINRDVSHGVGQDGSKEGGMSLRPRMTLLPMKPAREGEKRAPIMWEFFFFFFLEAVRSRNSLESTRERWAQGSLETTSQCKSV